MVDKKDMVESFKREIGRKISPFNMQVLILDTLLEIKDLLEEIKEKEGK